jgi:predicted membrane protein
MLILIGAALLLHNYGIRVFKYGWPVLIILLGLFLLYHSLRRRTWKAEWRGDFTLVGDVTRTGSAGALDGAHFSHFVGDIDLNLAGSQLKPGINRMAVSHFVGDIRIIVPRGMAVEASGFTFVGDASVFDHKESGLGVSCKAKTASYDTAADKLQLTCNQFVGDILIKEE